ncbi:MAG: hypothetical protein IH840_10510 [Candidatus Heimdallarchaeota archaeon]|nr:hypothetical protein [Candidatus Heimdallarchaeota archaeon]
MPKEVYHSEPISIPEVKKLLLSRAREGEELSYMQRIALEHAQLVSRIDAKVAKELVDLLIEKFRLTNKGAITLANYIPTTVDEVRQLLWKEALSMETETLEQILEEVSKVDILDTAQKKLEIDDLTPDNNEEEEETEVDSSMIPEDLR